MVSKMARRSQVAMSWRSAAICPALWGRKSAPWTDGVCLNCRRTPVGQERTGFLKEIDGAHSRQFLFTDVAAHRHGIETRTTDGRICQQRIGVVTFVWSHRKRTAR